MIQESRGELVDTEDESRRRRGLGRCGVFQGVSEEEMSEVVRKGVRIDLDRRQSLYRPDSEPALYVLVSGRVRVLRKRGDDVSVTLDYHGPGDLVGEDALLGGHSAEAVVIEPVEAVRVPVGVLRRAMTKDGRFAGRVLELVLARRLAFESRLEALVERPVESRVASFLVEAAARYGIPDSRGILVAVKFTHQEVASFVGSTRETVTLVLGELKRAGLIDTDRRRFIVVDNPGLAARV